MRQFHTTTFYIKMIPSYLNRALGIRAFHQRTHRRLRSSELTGIVSFEYLTSTHLSSALKNLTHQGTNHRGIYFVLYPIDTGIYFISFACDKSRHLGALYFFSVLLEVKRSRTSAGIVGLLSFHHPSKVYFV